MKQKQKKGGKLKLLGEGPTPIAIICPKCKSMNVRQIARRMKTKYGRVRRKFRCENYGHVWAEERRR